MSHPGRRPARRARTAALALLAPLAMACGGGPSLTNLRCRGVHCQQSEQPYTLQLAVDFDDPSGTLGRGSMELRLNGSTQVAVSLADLFSAQHLATTATNGTIDFDQDVALDNVTSGGTFNTSVIAHDGNGKTSNEPVLNFTEGLVGP
jgi:hypothetical protein